MLDKSKTNFTLGFDKLGMPVLNEFTPTLFSSLFTAGVYYFSRLFSSREEKEKEQKSIAQLISFLYCIKLTTGFDEFGAPTLKLVAEEEKPRRKKKHRSKPNAEFVPVAESPATEMMADTPQVIEGKHGTVIYQIQNFNVYFTADVVQQLNMNPQQVVTIIQDQVQAQFEKLEKAEVKPENVNLKL